MFTHDSITCRCNSHIGNAIACSSKLLSVTPNARITTFQKTLTHCWLASYVLVEVVVMVVVLADPVEVAVADVEM